MPPDTTDPTATPRWQALMPRIVVTVLAAAILPLLSAPLNLHWLHWVAYLPMFWVLRADEPRVNRWLSWHYGFVAVMLIFHWIVATIAVFSNIATPLAWGILFLFAAAFGLPYVLLWAAVHPLRKRLGDGWILALPAWLVVLEWLSMNVILFPYNQGISQYRMPEVWQLASVTGVWGLSWLVLFFNCAFAEAIYRHREGRPFPVRWAAVAVAVLSTVVIWGGLRYDRIEAELAASPTLDVGMIQTAKTMTHRFSESRQQMLYDWLAETDLLIEATEPGDIDLVVWSEGASPYNVHDGRVFELISDRARAGQFEMFVGGGTIEEHDDGERQWIEAYNSVYVFGRDGGIRGRYDKVVPLPFGEYLPLANVFPILREWIQGPGDFRAGPEPTVIEAEIAIAAPICYEAVLPSLCRRFPDPDLLINPTNDAWFGDTAAPHQHAMLAAARATELGTPLIRSGYTGVSFVVEPHGRIYAETDPYVRVTRVVRVRMADVDTPYERFGDWFVWLCGLGLAAAWAISPWRRRTEPALVQ